MVRPIVTFTVVPESIDRGQSAELSWTTFLAHTVTVGGVRKPLSGSWTIYPTKTTTILLIATGYGGTTTKTVTVTVTEPSPPPPPPEGRASITKIDAPSEFILGVPFRITTYVKNVGDDGALYVKLIDLDTMTTMRDFTSPLIPSGVIWEKDMDITLVQTTTFRGRVEAGHIE